MTKLQKKKTIAIIKLFSYLTIITILILQFFNFAKYPELYSTTLRYQLKNDLIDNDADAWTYYENIYLANGVILYQDI